jgi:hypothetical protein
MDVSKLLDDLDLALTSVDKAKSVVDAKRAVADKAALDLGGAQGDHKKAVDAANAIREQVNGALAEKLGVDPTGRVR